MLNIRINCGFLPDLRILKTAHGSYRIMDLLCFFLRIMDFAWIEQIRTPGNFLLKHGKREYFWIFVDPNLNQNILEFVDLVNTFCGLSDLP